MTQCKRLFIAVLTVSLATAGAPAAYALTNDQLVAGAKECTRYINRYERQYAIPTHLLSAIATTESGRYHNGIGISVPWPWTINVQGKGHYFDTKQEAIQAVRKYMAQGIKSIDVGCMQVNLHHHDKAFASLDQAFNPEQNVAYAASFLHGLYQDSNSWKTAAAHYHSKTPTRGVEYAGSVYSSWYKIIDKLRTARTQTGTAEPVTRTVASADKPVAFKPSSRSVKKLPEQQGKKVAKYHAPRMKVIELSKASASRQDTKIVTPFVRMADKPAIVTVAQVEPASLSVTQTVDMPSVSKEAGGKILRMNSSSAPKRTQPTFIFTN